MYDQNSDINNRKMKCCTEDKNAAALGSSFSRGTTSINGQLLAAESQFMFVSDVSETENPVSVGIKQVMVRYALICFVIDLLSNFKIILTVFTELE